MTICRKCRAASRIVVMLMAFVVIEMLVFPQQASIHLWDRFYWAARSQMPSMVEGKLTGFSESYFDERLVFAGFILTYVSLPAVLGGMLEIAQKRNQSRSWIMEGTSLSWRFLCGVIALCVLIRCVHPGLLYGAMREAIWPLLEPEAIHALSLFLMCAVYGLPVFACVLGPLILGSAGDSPAQLCEGCHYDLRHLREQRCPECGRPFAPKTH